VSDTERKPVPAEPKKGIEYDFRATPTRISARRENAGWELYEKDPLTDRETLLNWREKWEHIYRLGRELTVMFDGQPVDRRAAAAANPLPPVTEPMAGWVALARQAAVPNHWGDAKPDTDAFRCPYCGKWRPGYLFNGQRAALPPSGTIEYMNVHCQDCRVLLQIIIIGFDPGLGRRGMPQ